MPSDALQARDWSHIKSGAQFEKEYAKVYGGSLKGGEWGRALARYAKQCVPSCGRRGAADLEWCLGGGLLLEFKL